MDTDRLKEFAELEGEKAEIKNRLNEITRRLEVIGPELLDDMIDDGIQNINISGRAVHIRKDIWAKVESTKEQVVKALKESGLEEYVTVGFNHHSISSYIRHQVEAEEPLPDPLKGHLSANTVLSVRSTKA